MVYRRKGKQGWWFHYDDPETTRQCQRKCENKRKRAAELEAAQFKGELARQFVPISSDDFCDFVRRDYWPSQQNHLTQRALQREQGILDNHLGPYFTGPMRRINRALIISYIAKRFHEKASRETVRKELHILKHALRIAVKTRQLERNPFDDLERQDWPAQGEKRTRHLVEEEWRRLIRHIPVANRAAVVLLVNSGMRRGELMNLEWTDLNLVTGMAWIAKTKGGIRTGKGRWVKLNQEMCRLVGLQPRLAGNPKVFSQFTPNSLTVAFRRAVVAAGLNNFRLHDLRHTFATALRKAGIGIDVIAELLGHADLRQSQIYAHIADESLHQAVQSIEGQFTYRIGKQNSREFSYPNTYPELRSWRPVGDSNPCCRRERAVS